jgi:hypothetical protein
VVRGDGALAGYRWGIERKRALIAREGRLQERYGYAKDQARKDVDTWFSTLK